MGIVSKHLEKVLSILKNWILISGLWIMCLEVFEKWHEGSVISATMIVKKL